MSQANKGDVQKPEEELKKLKTIVAALNPEGESDDAHVQSSIKEEPSGAEDDFVEEQRSPPKENQIKNSKKLKASTPVPNESNKA